MLVGSFGLIAELYFLIEVYRFAGAEEDSSIILKSSLDRAI